MDSSERLGRHHWVVERTIAWLLAFHRLALRSVATITAVATLAITSICARRLLRKNY